MCAWVIYFAVNRRHLLRNAAIISSLALLFLIISSIINMDGVEFVVSRLSNLLSGKGDEETSTFLRMFRGFQDWSELSLFGKIFGAGFGSWNAANAVYNFSSKQVNDYMSTISYILFSTGVFGLLFYAFFMFDCYLKGNILAKLFVIVLFVVSICSSVYSSLVFVWCFAIILLSQKTPKEKAIRKGLGFYNASPQCN